MFLYEHAKALGFGKIPKFNNVEGYIIGFDELVGSIPEHMRKIMEEKEFDEVIGWWRKPNLDKLHEWYLQEVTQLLRYMRYDTKRVPLKDPETEETTWIDVPITRLSVRFNRFEQVGPSNTQTTAFFSVSDISPDFKPEARCNLHLQDTSRWLYAGAIALTYSKDENGKETISISSHH